MAALTTIALAATAVGAGISAYSSYQQGQTAKKVARFNAAEQRAEALRQQMETSREASRMQANRNRSMAALRARYAKSGVEFSGSPVEVLAEKSAIFDMEIADLQRNGAGSSARMVRQAGITEMYGNKAAQAGTIQAGTDILGGLTQIYGAAG